MTKYTVQQFLEGLVHPTVRTLHHHALHILSGVFRATPSHRQMYLAAMRLLVTHARALGMKPEEVLAEVANAFSRIPADVSAAIARHYEKSGRAADTLRQQGLQLALRIDRMEEMPPLDESWDDPAVPEGPDTFVLAILDVPADPPSTPPQKPVWKH